ncbi:hypothetical protein VNO77_19054 [Canavalia gladiata]|uniref:Uncharacterized protein n=1 Tax=Canavalia gladiata TaxID=3824 RepID=A0AAN9LM07_CANGL
MYCKSLTRSFSGDIQNELLHNSQMKLHVMVGAPSQPQCIVRLIPRLDSSIICSEKLYAPKGVSSSKFGLSNSELRSKKYSLSRMQLIEGFKISPYALAEDSSKMIPKDFEMKDR